MNLDRKTVLKILFIIFVSILLFVTLPRLGAIFSWIGIFLGVLTPFTIGLCMAFVINIPMRLIERKAFRKLNQKGGKTWLRIRRPLCLTLSILFFVLVIALLLMLIIPALKVAVEKFAINLPSYMVTLETKLSGFINNLTGDAEGNVFTINWDTISKSIIDFVHKNDGDTISLTIEIISGTVSVIFNVILGLIFSIYILASKERLGRQIRSLLYSVIKKEKVDKFLSLVALANSTFGKFVVGQFTEAIILGSMCAVGMLIFRMPYVPVVSCIIGITALVPVFGAWIGTALGAFIILLDSPIKALWFIIFIIILQQFETNVIYPRVMGKSIGLPGIWVLFAVTVGGGLFGAAGMLLGVPVCSVIYTVGERWIKGRLIQRNIDSDTLNRVRTHHEKPSKKERAALKAEAEAKPVEEIKPQTNLPEEKVSAAGPEATESKQNTENAKPQQDPKQKTQKNNNKNKNKNNYKYKNKNKSTHKNKTQTRD